MLSDLLLLGLHSGAREAFAYPVEDGFFLVLGAKLAHFSHFFHIWEHLFHIFGASYVIMPFLIDSFRMFIDF